MTDVRIEGLKIRVRDVGDGPPVLLINGLGAPTSWWATLEHRLPGLRLISFDAPGVGHSQTPLQPVRVDGLAAIAAGVLDACDVERADVLGYSLGGMVAQEFALRHPGRVRRLVLAATSCGLGGVPAALVNLLGISTPLRFERTTGGMLGGRARTDPEFRERHKERRLVDPPSKRGYMLQVMSLQGWSSLSRLAQIDAPTLVVVGDDDPLMRPANGYILARQIPGARLHIATGEGHLLLLDEASVAFAPIAAFLQGNEVDAIAVDDDDLAAAIAAAGRSPQPLALLGGAMRRIYPPKVAA